MFSLDFIHHGREGSFSFVLPYTDELFSLMDLVMYSVVSHFDFCDGFKAFLHGGHEVMAFAKVIHATH